MKSLAQYISEKPVIKKNKTPDYKYFPKTKEELKDLIKKRIKKEGNNVDLNDINVSEITDMSNLFEGTDFNGDISRWDVSNVKDMVGMFSYCLKFNQDISRWDVSNVTDMGYMFNGCKLFNQDISPWDVSNVIDMEGLFYNCESFDQDISSWDVSNVKYMDDIFSKCPIEAKYKPKLK